jgi:NAD(P)-dependent dehydrogenase (short-subunit alcohol dehydrogenase family)
MAPTAVITGASNGIGLRFARNLLAKKQYGHVLFSARSQARCDELLAAIADVDKGETRVDALVCDMAALVSVRDFCTAVAAKVDSGAGIALLVLNAGMISGSAFAKTSVQSADGLEAVFAVNHLAHFLMVRELLPLLRVAGAKEAAAAGGPSSAARGSRVVLTASEGHAFSKPPRKGKDEASWREIATVLGRSSCFEAYADSKLANVLTAQELQRRFAGEGITANSLHPGGIRDTGIWAPQAGLAKFLIDGLMFPIGNLFGVWQSVDDGASAIAACVESPEGGLHRNVHKWVGPAPIGKDPEVAKALWGASEALLAEKLRSP